MSCLTGSARGAPRARRQSARKKVVLGRRTVGAPLVAGRTRVDRLRACVVARRARGASGRAATAHHASRRVQRRASPRDRTGGIHRASELLLCGRCGGGGRIGHPGRAPRTPRLRGGELDPRSSRRVRRRRARTSPTRSPPTGRSSTPPAPRIRVVPRDLPAAARRFQHRALPSTWWRPPTTTSTGWQPPIGWLLVGRGGRLRAGDNRLGLAVGRGEERVGAPPPAPARRGLGRRLPAPPGSEVLYASYFNAASCGDGGGGVGPPPVSPRVARGEQPHRGDGPPGGDRARRDRARGALHRR